MKDYKQVSIKNLNIGDTFSSYHKGNMSSMGATYTVEEITETEVICRNSWTKELQSFSKETIFVDIPMTEKELHIRDFDKAKEIAEAFEHQLYDPGDAPHEMWNGWLMGIDPYDIAAHLKEDKITIIGWFYLTYPKGDLDIGVVAEDFEGDRFWCHAKKSWYSNWKKWYPELYK